MNELGQFFQDVRQGDRVLKEKRVSGTDYFLVIQYNDIPLYFRKDITYTKVVCEVQPQKSDPNRNCITIGGNRICYPGDIGTPTCSLELVKIIINRVLSRLNTKFTCFGMPNFYLATPMHRSEYFQINLDDIS